MTAEQLKQMQSRLFERFPKLKEEFDKKVKKDPEVATDTEKWRAFLGEMRQKGIVQFGGGGRPRGDG